MIGDPYEEAQEQFHNQAKILVPEPAKRSRKGLVAALALVGSFLALVMLANIAGLFTGHGSGNSIGRPTTVGKKESDAFARQQAYQAEWMKGMDSNHKSVKVEEAAMGYGADAFDEIDGIPKKTKAQDDAMRGNGGAPVKSAAEEARERALLEAANRRKNDLESSPASLDFSDYFAREKTEPTAAVAKPAETAPATESNATTEAAKRRPMIADALGVSDDPAKDKRQARNPSDDYVFDSAFGKLYRLMEDTILETVLVNRLAGAAAGPVITMVTTDIYSGSGSHLLIPKGTRMLGGVSAVASLNQERLFVGFHRMIMPDGYSVSLDKFQGLDVVGETGLRDLVNHHYLQIFGASIALAGVGAVTQIGNNASFGAYDWGVQMRSNMSEQLGQSAQRVMERFLNVLPTFTIRERARVKIMLSGDLLLPNIKNHTMDPDL